MEKLERKALINYFVERNEIKQINASKDEYVKFLNELENLINNHEFLYDERFVTYGRRNFLKQEFNNFLQNNKFMNCLIDLEEYVYGHSSFFTFADIPQTKSSKFHDILKKHDDYYRDGIICLQEKDILLQMITDFKTKLNSV